MRKESEYVELEPITLHVATAVIRIAGSDEDRWCKCKGAWNLAAIVIAGAYAKGQRPKSLAAIRIAGRSAKPRHLKHSFV